MTSVLMVKVLIVDDSVYMRDLLKKILATSGHQVVGEASQGDEAFNLYKALKTEK